MQGGDLRAVENPISAIFDLAEDVQQRLPKIRKALRYTRIFVSAWLLIDALFIVSLPGTPVGNLLALLLLLPVYALLLARRWVGGGLGRTALTVGTVVVAVPLVLVVGVVPFGLLLVGLFYLGMAILELLADLRRFLDYYALRHRVIQSVREQDPVVYVPKGNDVVQRLLAHLSARNPAVRALAARPRNVQAPAILRGASGLTYHFDAFVGAPASLPWRVLGLGAPGFSLFVKAFDHPPTRKDVEALKRAAEEVCAATGAPPSRVIAVWRAAGDQGVDREAYDFVTSQVVTFAHRGATYRCSLEIITESPDGTYDFIPYVSDAVYAT